MSLQTKPLISIIDDDESCREALAGLMNWLGCAVQTFASAIEFLDAPSAMNSSCIITDVQMPQMTGIELHNRLKSLGYDIPTILITAYPNEEDRASQFAGGVTRYLTKPFDQDALITGVRSVLNSESG